MLHQHDLDTVVKTHVRVYYVRECKTGGGS